MALKPLPDLILLSNYGGNWDDYLSAVYAEFLDSVVNSKLTFLGKNISCQYRPDMNGMHYGFWHIITENLERFRSDDDRTPDFRRCERIAWIAHVILNAETDRGSIRCWRNKRGSNSNIVLWIKEEDFVVILSERNDYLLLKTAYVLDKPHTRSKFYNEMQKSVDPRVGIIPKRLGSQQAATPNALSTTR